MKRSNTKKLAVFSLVTMFTITGIYNSVVINAASTISGDDVKFVKRIDEMYGVITPGRMVAASVNWRKLPPQQNALSVKPKVVEQTISQVQSAPATVASSEAPAPTAAAIQEELNLNLVEVVNLKKYANGINSAQFSGDLSTNNGTIDSLNVSLPNGEGFSVSFSEMTGNVFEYDCEQEVCTGMLYQVDQNSYMVTLSNGPLEGTRLRFTKPAEVDEQQLAQQYVEQPGNFGQDPNMQAQEDTQQNPNQPQFTQQDTNLNMTDQEMQHQAEQAQWVNPEQQQPEQQPTL